MVLVPRFYYCLNDQETISDQKQLSKRYEGYTLKTFPYYIGRGCHLSFGNFKPIAIIFVTPLLQQAKCVGEIKLESIAFEITFFF